MYIDANTSLFEVVTVLDKEMLFCIFRVSSDTLPDGVYKYEVRHDDDQQGIPVEIAKKIVVNHWGTLISKVPIEQVENNSSVELTEDDWNYEGYEISLDEYISK